MDSQYVEWLKQQGVPLFYGGGIYWRIYQRALVPAPAFPCFLELSQNEAKSLLNQSASWLIRYASEHSDVESVWWYVICDSYDSKRLSSKVRNEINRGYRNCVVRMIDADWLSRYGYACYSAAYSRYRSGIPGSQEAFRMSILQSIGGPFEYWGVFVEDRLAGYCQCIVDNNDIVMNIAKYDPSFLRERTAYALVSSLIKHYVVDHNMTISNSNRSISHDTNYQELLLKLGFRKRYCKLNVVYKPWLKTAVQIIFPIRNIISSLPKQGHMNKVKALLYQEELRRVCSDK